MKDSLHVEVEHPVPSPGVVIFERRSPGSPSVVYQHVERVPALFHRVSEPPASLLAREVLGDRDAFAHPGQLFRHRGARLGLAAADQDRSTILHERPGDHQPNAGGASRDDHTLTLHRKQLARTHPHPSLTSPMPMPVNNAPNPRLCEYRCDNHAPQILLDGSDPSLLPHYNEWKVVIRRPLFPLFGAFGFENPFQVLMAFAFHPEFLQQPFPEMRFEGGERHVAIPGVVQAVTWKAAAEDALRRREPLVQRPGERPGCFREGYLLVSRALPALPGEQ